MTNNRCPEKPTRPETVPLSRWFSDREAAHLVRYVSDFPRVRRSDAIALCFIVQNIQPETQLPAKALKFLVTDEAKRLLVASHGLKDAEFISVFSHLYTRLRLLPEANVAQLVFSAVLAQSQPCASNKLIWFNIR
jgi:hypothetical protein